MSCGKWQGQPENKASHIWGGWEAWCPTVPASHSPLQGRHAARCSHTWLLAHVKKDKQCEKFPWKEVVVGDGEFKGRGCRARGGATRGRGSGLQKQGRCRKEGKGLKVGEAGFRAEQGPEDWGPQARGMHPPSEVRMRSHHK